MRVPASTYRFQVTADFDLFEVARRLPYVHEIGADWVYLSPLLEAERGSTHGYDVVRHDRVDPARGGAEGLAAVSAEARRLGMGVLVDIVPNHVGVATPHDNPWWWDLLRHGPASSRAAAFDVDWAAGGGRVLIPVVGDGDEGSIRVEDGEVRYHEHRFPMAPGTTTVEEQNYELVSWRRGDHELNYRRFFTVTTLAGIRVEDPQVLADSHVEIRRWFDEGLVDGLRVDHPDGLRDPGGYLDDLAAITGGAYVLVEKILEPGERLPDSWATAGTTGYDALGLVDRVLTDSAGRAALDALETRLRGTPVEWADLIHRTKRDVADGVLRAEVNRIVRELLEEPRVSTGSTGVSSGSLAHETVADAVAELLACFPVYRSYLPEGRDHFDLAFAAARTHRSDLAATFDALAPVLGDPEAAPAKRLQQTSGMVMAKGVEDCAFYRYSRLTSLNEVGGDPSEFSLSVEEFHERMTERQAERPHAMTALTTHDTKRGEDVRARISVLSELPDMWASALGWLLELAPIPDPGFGSLLWQAILGAWPASPERLHGYAEKAMREAGDRTTWTDPDPAYEAAVHAAVDAAFDDKRVRVVLDGLLARVVVPGRVNGLSAKLLSITMPGVPDVYQGSELWEQSLVDPDNRRPVDFDTRAEALVPLQEPAVHPLTDRADDGFAKLQVTHRALRLRRDRPELFTTYRPVAITGSAAGHVLAFDRGGAITVATRLPVGLTRKNGWGETALDLPAGTWRDVITGGSFEVSTSSTDGGPGLAEMLAALPVALLVKEN